MAPNTKTQAIIEAARERTRKMLEEQKQRNKEQLSAIHNLPSSVDLHPARPKAEVYDDVVPSNDIITVGGNTFNPYELDGLILNEQQRRAVDLFGLQGQSGCLIGPAGTGKTTTMKAVIRAAILSGRIPILPEDMEHKYLAGGLPGIFGGSFTRIATRNLRNNCPPDIQGNIHTIHRLLEFEPEIIEVDDPNRPGYTKKIRIFKPTRHSFRPLDQSLSMFIIDESSMVGYSSLHRQLIEAINPNSKAQMLYIGDIAQLPPVMDDAVLGYKLIEFDKEGKVVELTQVYRHAGAIVNLANQIRTGNTIPNNRAVVPYSTNLSRLPFKLIQQHYKEDGWEVNDSHQFSKEEDGSKVTIRYWKNRLNGDVGQLKALQNLGLSVFPKMIESGEYDPMKHMILMPYNKSVGTIELNKYLANYLGKKREAEVHEVIAGFIKHYLAIGDKIFFDREESIITGIAKNGVYAGTIPQAHAVTLDRWGHNTAGASQKAEEFDDVMALLNINVDGVGDEERKHQASHILTIKKLAEIEEYGEEQATEYKLQTASEINGLIFGYALTIHKSQGSQWPKVFCVFHNSHNRNLQRELLYTAITRAQKELYVIAEPETFIQGVTSQHIVGNTLAEKAEYFKGKVAADKRRQDLFNKTQAPTTDDNGDSE